MENFLRYVKKLSKVLFIVEGKKDKKALQALGLVDILDISGKTLNEMVSIVNSLDFSQVAVLTDFDREGKEIHKLLVKLLEINGIKVNSRIRGKFVSLFKVSKVEEIISLTKIP